jgi:hypothetical protein
MNLSMKKSPIEHPVLVLFIVNGKLSIMQRYGRGFAGAVRLAAFPA